MACHWLTLRTQIINGRVVIVGKTLLGMLCMWLAALNVYAEAGTVMITTLDGRPFESLAPADIETLSGPDQAAYQIWQAGRDAEQSSTYQASEGPNTMDISSDFSM